ncbi:glycosyltransferase [Candidatus Gracilibacteria bacterium]|nr:glycosyltransferase [Candidatus Gracilibacteria bacterium]
MLNLASSFVRYGLQIDLVLGKAWGSHIKKVPPEIRLVDLKASGFLSTTKALMRYLRQERPVVLLSALHYANEIALLAKRFAGVSTRVIVSEHNTFSIAIRRTSISKRRFLPFFVRYFYPWADAIVAVSEGVAKDLAQNTGLPIESIQTIYNPIITPEIFVKAKEPLDSPWFTSGEPPVILGVGKLEVQKDFTTLIRAFARIRQTRPARLMILGWGPDLPKLEALVQELGLEEDVSLLGYVDNPYPYMARADVFALSSKWEGFGNVLVESMALGTPVVSTNCKSGPAEILNNGQYGLLAPVGDSDALAEAIINILANGSKPVSPTWLDRFTSDRIAQKYIETFAI